MPWRAKISGGLQMHRAGFLIPVRQHRKVTVHLRPFFYLKAYMQFFAVKDWETHQHYSKRNPPWIKLHRSLIDDYSFCALPDESKAHLMMLWIFASQHNGKIPNDPTFLERKLSCSKINLDILVQAGFLLEKQ